MTIKHVLTGDERHALRPFLERAERAERSRIAALNDLSRAVRTVLKLGPADHFDVPTLTVRGPAESPLQAEVPNG